MQQLQFELTLSAQELIIQFLRSASRTGAVSSMDQSNGLRLITQTLVDNEAGGRGHAWYDSQPIHAFEALVAHYDGQNVRYPPLSLNLHYTRRPDGTYLIAAPMELPLHPDYFVRKVIEEARVTGGN